MSISKPPPQRPAPLTIGTIAVANSVVVAPMSGVTDAVFRRLAARQGAGLVVSEMIASPAYVVGHEETRLRAEGEGLPVHVVQLAGREPQAMAEAARLAQGAGAHVIDINMGCPAKKVTGGQCGAALLRDLDLACRIIAATVAAVGVPVTVKMRLGWSPDAIVAPELARRAESLGVAMVTVHGRTRDQFYSGRADWHAIRAIREAVSIPVVANGDVASEADALAILEASGADAVMIGRAAQGRIWLPGAVAHFLATGERRDPPPLAAQHDLAVEHYEGLVAQLGAAVGVRHARKHLDWTLEAAQAQAGRRVEGALRQRIVTAETPKAALAGFRDAFEDLSWRMAA